MLQLKDLRKESHKTQAQVAAYLGISQQGYSAIENGTNQASYDILQKLADYFNVTIDELLGRSSPYPAGSIDEMKVELKRLGIDGNDREQLALWEKIQGLTPEQKQLIVAMINNFKD